MSFNKFSPSTSAFTLFTLALLALAGALRVNCAHADNEVQYRQEPISPIPQKVEFNKARADLGETLFFDVRLSKNDTIACASCHQLDNGGDDGLTFGLSTSSGQNIINTPSIFNTLYNFRHNWNGSTKTLEAQIDASIRNRHAFDSNWDTVVAKLTADKKLTKTFDDVYTDGLTKDNIIAAIVEFEKTLTTPNSRFDRYLRYEPDSLSKMEIEGYQTFKELGCISCHQGINIGGNLFQKFGVFYNYIAERGNITESDYGRINVTRRRMDKFVFKVPSLRNITVTAPYLHDGSAATIEEAIEIMGKTQLGRILTVDEVLSIKAFLNTLTGEYKNASLDVGS